MAIQAQSCLRSRPLFKPNPTNLLSALLFTTILLLANAASAGVKVAFTGDQGTDDNARAVLSLIRNEGSELLLVQGDLGYDDNSADKWEQNINDKLGRNFPVMTVIGNHDDTEWSRYRELIQQRIDRVNNLHCAGRTGMKMFCQYANIDVVQVAPGIHNLDGIESREAYAEFIKSSFANSGNRWRICSWHKVQNKMQTGLKDDGAGWDVYNACLNVGAMVATAHEHAWSRTHLMRNFETQSIEHKNSEMLLEPGKSFAFVSGLGGWSIRPQERGGDWFASIYSASQGATHGALFCDFETDTAECYFKAVDGSVPDRFSLRLRRGSGSSPSNGAAQNDTPIIQAAAPPPDQGEGTATVSISADQAGYVFSRTDKNELRWIDRDSSGGLANTWISKECADQHGGPAAYGDWAQLVMRAPGLDTIYNPCGTGGPTTDKSSPVVAGGFVFARTDINEFRWIDRDGSNGLGSIWIDESCATQLGGPSVHGDWHELSDLAPNQDAIASPCNNLPAANAPGLKTDGYVFARTDDEEFRWVAMHSSGELGSTWIDRACAERMGGASVSGNWEDLMQVAPRVDEISPPSCE